MEEKELYSLLSFIRNSNYRKKILFSLEKPLTPTDLVNETDIKLSNVSKVLGELRERGLVEVINPEDRKWRYYKLTEKGEGILEEINK